MFVDGDIDFNNIYIYIKYMSFICDLDKIVLYVNSF